MMKLIFAANWKMHFGPTGAAEFLAEFLRRYESSPDREVWFFPSAVAASAVNAMVEDRSDIKVGVQNVFWEPKGAFTGEMSAFMASEAGAVVALVGHSERRHLFGESDADTTKKVNAVLESGMTPLLCVGERLEEREAGHTLEVVNRQLDALDGLQLASLETVTIAYEPVWAIGTGKTATPADAAEVHGAVKDWFASRGVDRHAVSVLYGGSVKMDNVGALLSEPDIDGVLVGGASLDPIGWADISMTSAD